MTKPTAWQYIGSALSVGLATVVGMGVSQLVTLPHVSMLMLLAIFFSATRWGRGPAIFTAICSTAVSAFFFMPPIHDFRVSAPQDLIDLVVFFIAAFVTSHLASRVKLQTAEAVRRETKMLELSSFSRSLAGMLDSEGVLRATAIHCTVSLQRRAVLLIPRNGTFAQFAAQPGTSPLSDSTIESARRLWAQRDRTIADPGGSHAMSEGWEFRLLRGEQSPVGLVAIETAVAPIRTEDARTIDSLLPHISRTVERVSRIVDPPSSGGPTD